jgi:hypothetical protein
MKYRAAALLGLAAILPACDPSSVDVMSGAILLSVTPASPSVSQLPTFSGRAAAGSTIEIFTNPTASGTPAATGTASSSGTFDIVVGVPRPSQRTYYAFSTPARAPRSGPSNGLLYASRFGGFAPPSSFSVGGQPLFLAAGDFNLDGRLDAAVPNSSSGTVSVLLGVGDGTFLAATPLGGLSFPVGVAVADLDGDGRPDLAVSCGGNDTVSIQLGDGDGTFTAAAPVPIGSGPWGIAAADLDGDGDIDLAAAHSAGSSVSVLLGAGDGSFSAAPGSPIPVETVPLDIVVADLNGGLPDLLVGARGAGSVAVLLNSGGGAFTVTTLASSSPSSLATADFDGNGTTDLAVANVDLDTISTFVGTGGGAFTATVPPSFATQLDPWGAAAADFDGDGRIDLLASNLNSDSVSFFAGNGAGGFAAAATLPIAGGPRGLAVGDFNGDGAPDVAVVLQLSDAIGVLLAK